MDQTVDPAYDAAVQGWVGLLKHDVRREDPTDA